MPHTSDGLYSSACNCGRRVSNREDPFFLVEANYKFYAEMEEECCRELYHQQFPVFQGMTVEEHQEEEEEESGEAGGSGFRK